MRFESQDLIHELIGELIVINYEAGVIESNQPRRARSVQSAGVLH